MANVAIQNDFLDGINEVFSIMFTDRLLFSLLDEESTRTNIYGETSIKFYHTAIPMVGKIQKYVEKLDLAIAENLDTVTITIPTKQLIIHNIPHSDNDLKSLEKAKFSYNGVDYLVDTVKPQTLVADMWQMYVFKCTVAKKDSVRGEYY